MKTTCINGLAYIAYNGQGWQNTQVPYKDYMKERHYNRDRDRWREKQYAKWGWDEDNEEEYISFERWSKLVKWTGTGGGWEPKDSYSKMIIEEYAGNRESVACYI